MQHVLLAICLGEKETKADAARRFRICCIKTLGSRNSNSKVDNVLDWRIRFLCVGRRRFHEIEKPTVLFD